MAISDQPRDFNSITFSSETPFIFVKADNFFGDIDGSPNNLKRPPTIAYRDTDQPLDDGSKNPACSHGRVFRLNDDSLLIQFMRPRVWRIRFDPNNRKPSKFTDFNSRTIIQDTLSQLITTVDVVDPNTEKRKVEVQLWIQRDPFQIIGVPRTRFERRSCRRFRILNPMPSSSGDFLKKHTDMNYFNFDNMRYQNVCGHGSLNDREPLYHSEPFWVEVDSHPGYRSQVGIFIGNYSHICVDVGVKDAISIRVATGSIVSTALSSLEIPWRTSSSNTPPLSASPSSSLATCWVIIKAATGTRTKSMSLRLLTSIARSTFP
ncbi:hypothetical protein B0T10DRAFT_589233 [Thelonectria olida]|uniref:Uncharacterized protein n=1 Tax=Thelonectria olida TaxID=1576542 RepID=A0A9P8VU09_9HYPO|nr:hypothetical protein B0T10DRAFT_589233 [Thelonectria olida]